MHKDLFFTFMALEKAYVRVPMDLLYWCIRRGGDSEKLVRLVEASLHGASTVVRTTYGRTDEFSIKVGLYYAGIRAKPNPVYRSTRCDQRIVQIQAAM